MVVKMAIGLPLSLLGPLLVTAIVKGIEARWDGHLLPEFGTTFSLVTLLIVPFMLWYERRTSGNFYSDALHGKTFDRAASYGEYASQHAMGVAGLHRDRAHAAAAATGSLRRDSRPVAWTPRKRSLVARDRRRPVRRR